MLAAHLSQESEAASRYVETIERSVAWMIERLRLQPGQRVLDLGCGPGLYAARLAARGLRVTGLDFSRRSLDYARAQAEAQGLDIEYRYQDFTTLEEDECYDLVMQVYGELNTFSPARRGDLLWRIFRALKPGGRLLFDVTTRQHRARCGRKPNWYAADGGFWRAGPHLVLERGFDYPEQSLYCDQYAVVDAAGGLKVYRNWFLDYTADAIRGVLEAQGFVIDGVWGDLCGAPPDPDDEWIGVLAARPL